MGFSLITQHEDMSANRVSLKKRRFTSFCKEALFATVFSSILFSSVSASAVCTAISVPLYTWPGSTWTEVAAAKKAHPNVPIYVIANIDSNPGTAPETIFQTYIKDLQNAGVIVLGYISSNYATTPIATMKTQILEWHDWYKTNGIMIDTMNNTASQTDYSYYADLTAYAKTLGMNYTLGNPGAPTVKGYIGKVNAIQVREGSGIPSVATVKSVTFNGAYAASNFSITSYDVKTLDVAAVNAIRPYVGLIWVTSGVEPNPYNLLPPYFDALVAALDNDSCG